MSGRTLTLTLPFALPSLNALLRQHWAQRGREEAALRQLVMAAVGGPRHFPRPAFEKARVTVLRISPGQLDPDNAAASAKLLLDVLKEGNARNPLGLSFMRDDSPDRCELVVTQQRGAPAMTVVKIEELPMQAAPTPPAKTKRQRNWTKLPKPATARAKRLHRKVYGLPGI